MAENGDRVTSDDGWGSAGFGTADVYVISFPKCGRTWLRTLMGKAISEARNLPFTLFRDLELLEFSRADPSLPKIKFLHDDGVLVKTPGELSQDKSGYRAKRVVLLTRDLRDVAVSRYFQLTRGSIERFEDERFQGDLDEFIRYDRGSLRTCIEFWNIWYRCRSVPADFLRVSYEQLAAAPAEELGRILAFCGITGVEDAVLRSAAEFAGFENMRAMEQRDLLGSWRLRPGNPDDPESFKTRRGIIGGFSDYLREEQVSYLDSLIVENLVKPWWPAAFAAGVRRSAGAEPGSAL